MSGFAPGQISPAFNNHDEARARIKYLQMKLDLLSLATRWFFRRIAVYY
jgi:hypothetical protein